jgi:predicted alpha-1,2-mannosidase
MKTVCAITTVIQFLILAVMSLTGLAGAASGAEPKPPRLCDYVRPLVGTSGEGNTYPGPSAPFGMVQFSPDTTTRACGGYVYHQHSILGFSLTHLTGTGIPDLGDFLFAPQVGDAKFEPGDVDEPGYRSHFSHDDEVAAAGHYRVKLGNDVTVELTAGARAGIMRLTFPESTNASVLTDLKHTLQRPPGGVVWSHVRVENNSTVTGFHLVNGWARERYLYFAARYSRPFDRCRIISGGKPVVYDTYRFRSRNEAAGTNLQFIAEYNTKKDEIILVKIGISAVSAANALQNLDAEIPDWNFEKVKDATRDAWDRELGKFQIEGSPEQKETFYTSVYHAFLAPNLYEDANGEYRGFDGNTHEAKGFTNYAVFSLWDTYRATHPLFTLIQSARDADMINALLAHYDQSADHLLPVWSLQAGETWCMIGYHAVPVIADGYLKGVKGFDAMRAYEAIKTTAMNPDYDSVMTYAKLGWVPFDLENESVSKTLEYAFDDFSIAQMAKALGKKDDYEYFMKRAGSFKNVYDPSVGFMRGKDSQGKWREPFDPLRDPGRTRGDITEGNSWQYSWYAPQDVPGLIALNGGREKFAAKLDQLFSFPNVNAKQARAEGLIGQYWHGNEPSHHTIYLYAYAGQPWKAAERLHQVVSEQYGSKPDSLCGNDDCGQMSAWYLFTCMGFYPVCPAGDFYVFGAPQIPKVVMQLSNGKRLTTMAKNLSDKNIYVQSVRVNGKDWPTPFLPYREIKNGGTISYTMGARPGKWGTNPGTPE